MSTSQLIIIILYRDEHFTADHYNTLYRDEHFVAIDYNTLQNWHYNTLTN